MGLFSSTSYIKYMGLFAEFEQLGEIYWLKTGESDGLDYSDTPDVEMNLHIIRVAPNELDLTDDTVSNYETNPTGDHVSSLKRSSKVNWNGGVYKITENPEYYPLMNITKAKLIRFENGTETE